MSTAQLTSPPAPGATVRWSRTGRPGQTLRHGEARVHEGTNTSRDEELFLAWLTSPGKPDQVPVDGTTVIPLGQLLGRVSTSRRHLSPAAAAELGLAVGMSLGDAAMALLLAVRDPAGPRLRSYRAGVYYLQGIHRLGQDLDVDFCATT